MSYSIFDGDDYCGETYYCIDREHGNIASLDIKLFAKFRDKGIATKALSFTIEQAKLQGVEKVWVDPVAENKKAIRLYESLGFSACEMPKHILDQEGDDNVYMEKQL